MSEQILNIRQSCEQVLSEFADKSPSWTYVKAKKAFVRPVSKGLYIEVSTGFSSKVDFVNFQFGMKIGHKIMKQVNALRKMPKPYNDMLLYWHNQRWIPKHLNQGFVTIYDHCRHDLQELEIKRREGRKNYVRFEEFPKYLIEVLQCAEVEIERLFDITSEENLVRSIVSQSLGVFPAEQILITHLLMGNHTVYDDLTAYYDKPFEDRPHKTGGPFNKLKIEEIMTIYEQEQFPKFDFA